MSNCFLLSWDCYGLEYCVNITEIEKKEMWETLQSKDSTTNNTSRISMLGSRLIMRARFNPQRHYEIYTVEVEDGIDADDIYNLFKENPQQSAELIRQRGNKIYSDHRPKHNIKIT